MTRTALLPLALAIAAGCPAPPVECDTMAAASVNLTVIDPDDMSIATAQVTYAVDGGDPQACERLEGNNYVCGWEVAGTFDVQIAVEGYLPDRFSVTVDEDECHVIPQAVERTLTPVECTQQEVFGMLVNVTAEQGADITSATVVWGRPNADMAPMPCEYVSGNQWACAAEAFGLLELSISDAGPYQSFLQVVDVGFDGCDPVTETVDAVLAYLPD